MVRLYLPVRVRVISKLLPGRHPAQDKDFERRMLAALCCDLSVILENIRHIYDSIFLVLNHNPNIVAS